MAPMSPTSEVERQRASRRLPKSGDTDRCCIGWRLSSNPDDDGARLELGAALAANGEYEAALDHYLAVVKKKNERSDDARQGMVDIFEVLGADHPLAITYRRELANALF